jgi:murein DD-endopeptidase MepM/ murein hydrolase activator NlpD
MQLFWVSGAVGQIKTVNLTFKTLIFIFIGLALLMIGLGVILQYFGFRMAIEYDPTIARKLGNLHTAVELEHLHALYEAKLNDVNEQVKINLSKIEELEALNRKLSVMATPVALRKEMPVINGVGGQYNPIKRNKVSSPLVLFSHSARDIDSLNKQLSRSILETKGYLDWLRSKPTNSPLQQKVRIASGFGVRIDPFKFTPSFHSGVDFSSVLGTSFYSTARGVIVEAGWHPEYGNHVVIDHGEGFKTRYAHAEKVYVKKGMRVDQNALLGRVGTTGRSTAPHLHYEVILNGKRVNPLGYLSVQNHLH